MTTDKRYQVFVSSTFRDLIDERQAVLKAILEMDHMPAGMELFPAADESAWRLIKDVIDASDYYVLIIGGRYGSLDEAGLGYTEKEYDYAIASKKSVIPLLHENPNNLPRDKTETDETAWRKLQEFRAKVEKRHTCVYWNSPEELKARVIVGLTSTVKRHPAVGWIRADQVPTGATLADILALRDRVAELEKELAQTQSDAPPGTEDLNQGDDEYQIALGFVARDPGAYFGGQRFSAKLNPTWNELFAAVAPAMINEESDADLKKGLERRLTQLAKEEFKDSKGIAGKDLVDFTFSDHDLDTCIVQFRALGLIQQSDKKRSVKDTATYWQLTPYGDRLMVQLRALRRTPSDHQRTAGAAEEAKE